MKNYFIDKGVRHPDDMSGIILVSYHRYLNGVPIGLDSQVKQYAKYEVGGGFSVGDIMATRIYYDTLMSLFEVNDTVLTYVMGKSRRFFYEGDFFTMRYVDLPTSVVVKEVGENKLLVKIINIKEKPKYPHEEQIGDTFSIAPVFCNLIPPNRWNRPR